MSFDVDGLDPAFAPGTGTPECGGMSVLEAQIMVRGLRGLNLIPLSNLTRYGVTIGSMLEMPILFYALSLRGNRRRAVVSASRRARGASGP